MVVVIVPIALPVESIFPFKYRLKTEFCLDIPILFGNIPKFGLPIVNVAEAFNEATGCSRDNHCKDIARIQFVSYDPELYINENSITF